MIEVSCMSIAPLRREDLYADARKKVDPERLKKVDRMKLADDKVRSLGAGILLQYTVKQRIENWRVAGGAASGSADPACLLLRAEEVLERLREPFVLTYDYGPHGKPYLEQYPELFFSLSHSGEFCVCVMADCEVGADIQRIPEEEGITGREEKIAERFFAPGELEWLRADCCPREQKQRFYRIWAAKEAYIKLTGQGLARELNNFTALSEQRIVWDAEKDERPAVIWEPQVPAGYAAAICAWHGRDLE